LEHRPDGLDPVSISTEPRDHPLRLKPGRHAPPLGKVLLLQVAQTWTSGISPESGNP
jgi:hypothetical protein